MTGRLDGRKSVENVFQNLRGFERQHATRRDQDRHRTLRITTHAVLLVAHDEVTETRDLDLLASLERLLHHVEDGLDDFRGFFLRESAYFFVDRLDDVRFGHSRHRVRLTHSRGARANNVPACLRIGLLLGDEGCVPRHEPDLIFVPLRRWRGYRLALASGPRLLMIGLLASRAHGQYIGRNRRSCRPQEWGPSPFSG